MDGGDKLIKKALNKQKSGDAHGAAELFQKILRANPDHLDALYLLGAHYAQNGNLDRALRYTLRAEQLAPQSPYIQNNLGTIYRLRNELQQAARCFSRALQLKPDLVEGLNNLGAVYKRLGHADEAMEFYRRAIDYQPLFVEAHFNLGKALFDAQRWDEAAASFQRVLQLDAHHGGAHDGLGSALMKLGRNDEARAQFEEALRCDPQDACGASFKLAFLGSAPPPSRYSEALVRDIYANKAVTWDDDALRPAMRFLGPEHVSAAVERYLNDASALDIVDLGCGTGACGGRLRSRARTLIGVDLSPDMLRVAEGKNIYDRLIATDIVTYLEQHVASADVLVASGVLIFFGDLTAVFTTARRALRSGGKFIFTLYRNTSADIEVRGNYHFGHGIEYVRRAATAAGLAVAQVDEMIHEYEFDQPQAGMLVVLQKPST